MVANNENVAVASLVDEEIPQMRTVLQGSPDAKIALIKALCSAQARMPTVAAKRTNEFFKNSRYADLADIVETIRPIFAEAGLCFIHLPASVGVAVTVTCMIFHEAGASIECTITMKPEKATPQGIGSTITYCRRYTLAPLAGIVAAAEDDDGNAATNHGTANGDTKPPATKRSTPPKTVSPLDAAKKTLAAAIREWSGCNPEDTKATVMRFLKAMEVENPSAMSAEDITGLVAMIEAKKSEHTFEEFIQ